VQVSSSDCALSSIIHAPKVMSIARRDVAAAAVIVLGTEVNTR